MPQGKQGKKKQKLQLGITVTSAKQQKQLKVKKTWPLRENWKNYALCSEEKTEGTCDNSLQICKRLQQREI